MPKRPSREKRTRVVKGRDSKSGGFVFRSFVSRQTSVATKIQVIREGVRARTVDDIVDYFAVPKTMIFALLHTPESTAHRLIKEDRALDSAASERVVRVADVTRIAQATFGGRERAVEWLKTPNIALGRTTPLSMLDTEPGAAEVRRILSAIDYGGTL